MPEWQDWLEARVAEASDVFRDYIDQAVARYIDEQAMRERENRPTLAIIGHGRSGKDESGAYIGEHSVLRYGGSISSFVLPMVAHGLGLSEEEAWNKRHGDDGISGREYWYNWCNTFRRQDPLLMLKIVLSSADIVTGIRGREEFFAAHECGIFNHTLWIDRPGNPSDPTMGYTRDEALNQENVTEIVNDRSVEELHDKLKQYMYSINLQYLKGKEKNG